MKAVAKGRPRMTKTGRVYTPKKTKSWEQSVAIVARSAYSGKPLEKPLHVTIDFVLARPKRLMRKKDDPGLIWCEKKPDIDNLIKGVLDGINNSGLWRDDALVVKLSSSKQYSEKDGLPRVEVVIVEL